MPTSITFAGESRKLRSCKLPPDDLDVENDGGPIAACDLLYGCVVPGSRLNGAAQVMPPRIVGFSVGKGMQARLAEVINLKVAKDEVFGIEEKNQFIQPVDEQRD